MAQTHALLTVGWNHVHSLCSSIYFTISVQSASHNNSISTCQLASSVSRYFLVFSYITADAIWLSNFLCWQGTLVLPAAMGLCACVCVFSSGQSRVHLEQRFTHTGFQQRSPLPSLDKINQALCWNNTPSHILTLSKRKLLSETHPVFYTNAWWQAPT